MTIEDWDVLFSLRTLKNLNLRKASWIGALPNQWDQLSALRGLSLKEHSQVLPQSLVDSSLESFSLSDSTIANTDFSGMKNLKKLRLVGCAYSALELRLPSSLEELSISASPDLVHKIDFSTLPKLKILRIQTCVLDDLPASVYAHTSLQQLFVSYNDLKHLQSLQLMSSLKVLAIHNAQCHLTDEMLPSSLHTLKAKNCQYKGERFKAQKISAVPNRYATKDLDISVLSQKMQEGWKLFQDLKQQSHQ